MNTEGQEALGGYKGTPSAIIKGHQESQAGTGVRRGLHRSLD